jgi:hypothetical protein
VRSFSQYCDEDMGLIEEELAGEDDGAFARIEGHLRSKIADPAASRRGCLPAKAAAELAKEDPEVARVATDSYAVYTGALTDCLRAAQAAGDARDAIDAAAQASSTASPTSTSPPPRRHRRSATSAASPGRCAPPATSSRSAAWTSP